MKEIRKERTITNRSGDSLERYLLELSRYPLLNAEEEIVLAKRIRGGDHAALHKLVTCNLRFVVTVAKKYEMPGTSLSDLIAEGNVGLLKAAKRFDETLGFKFISYAVWWIRQAILDSINLHKRMIRLPANQLKGIADLWKAEGRLEQRLHRLGTLDEISEFMDLPYNCLLDYFSNIAEVSSFDVEIGDDQEETRVTTMLDRGSLAPDGAFDSDALRINVELMLNALAVREREILRLAYGMDQGRSLENREIANLLGLSPETVRRVKGKALTKLRGVRKIKIMQEFI